MSSLDLLNDCLMPRATVLPRRLREPGPTIDQVERLALAACQAPDHQLIRPWRLVQISPASRPALADVFEQDLLDRDAQCTPEERQRAREKAHRSPLLWLAVVRHPDDHPQVPLAERLVALGCALQNVLLEATAQGFGSSLTTGQAISSPGLAQLAKLAPNEQAVCFVSIGTVDSWPKPKQRPTPADVLSEV